MQLYLMAGLVLAVAWFLPLHLGVSRARRRRQLDRCWGHCWEIVLYTDHPRPMLAALADLWLSLLRFLWLLRVPLAVWLLVAVGVFSWLEPRAQRRCAQEGEAVLVSCSGRSSQTLEVPKGLQVSQPLWSPGENRTYWKLKSQQAGTFRLRCGAAEGTLEVGSGAPGWNPSGVLRVDYPQASAWLGDRPVAWELIFVLTLLPWFLLGEGIVSRLPQPGNR